MSPIGVRPRNRASIDEHGDPWWMNRQKASCLRGGRQVGGQSKNTTRNAPARAHNARTLSSLQTPSGSPRYDCYILRSFAVNTAAAPRSRQIGRMT